MADLVTNRAPGVAAEAPPREAGKSTSPGGSDANEASRAEDLPRPFGRYELRALLGRGGMGVVYQAHDPHLDRLVALKIPRPFGDDAAVWRERFQAEARAAATLHHPNICPVFEVGEVGPQPYLTMAYIEGETLAARLGRACPPSVSEAVALVRDLARAMAEAHERGIVHRDLKPANVMLDRRGQPVIMDFGLALRTAATDDLRLTLSGVALGTPSYMPPEQAGGDHEAIGPPADVYALGVILFELLTGRVPFRGATFGKLLAQIERDAPASPSSLNPAVDPVLDALILKALEKAPESRFATAGALADALDRYVQGERDPVQPRGSATVDRTAGTTATYTPEGWRARLPGKSAKPATRRPRRHAVAAGVLGFGLLAVLGVLIYVKTDYGDLVIELSDPTAQVDVKVDGQEVTLDPEGDPIRIRAGADQKLEVSGPGFETTGVRFDLKRGGRAVVQVRLKPRAEVARRPPRQPTAPTLRKPVDFPKQATLAEFPGWQILMDATKDEMQRWLDDREREKHSVTWLDAGQVGDRPVFAAVAALDDRESGWRAFLDLAGDEINDVRLLAERLELDAYRLTSLSGYADHDDIMGLALFRRPRPGETNLGSVGIVAIKDVRQILARGRQEGLVARLLRPFPIDDGRFPCALFAVSLFKSQELHGIDLNEDELIDQLEKYRSDGYRPVSVVAYADQGEQRFSATFRENPSKSAWAVEREMTAADLTAKAAELAADGLIPASVTICPWDGAVRYTAVWVMKAGE
ncbi:hypothetical protein BH23PLA1_BH23PLA1_37320 [soil metagenome]